MSLSTAADELYGTDPATFVARRTELAKRARTSGDKALAAQIGALRRPTIAAWYLNLLARSGSTELDDLIELGATMREAQAGLDMARVAALAPKRRELEQAVLRRVDMLLAARGTAASPAARAEVGQTLTAVAADESAASAVRSGCLARGLVYAGFGEVDLSDALGAELEAWVERRAADRIEAATQPPSADPDVLGEGAASVRAEAQPSPQPMPDRSLVQANARLAAAVGERQEARRAVDEIELAYATAKERLRAAEVAEAEARSVVEAAGSSM